MKVKPYPKYKSSSVEWLGVIPEHWEVKRLSRLASINYGVGGEIDRSLEYGIKIISLPNIDIEGRLNLDEVPFSEVPESEKRDMLLRKGDLLFNWRNGSSDHLGKTAIFNEDSEYTHVSFLLKIRFSNSSNNPTFFRYLINGYRINGFFKHSKAGVNNTFNLSELCGLPMICPPLHEQNTISAFLDREMSKIDTLVAKKKRFVELLREKCTAIISMAVTKGLDLTVKFKPSGVEWLGEVPEQWEVKKLKYIVSLKSGEGITSEELEDDGKYPVYGGNGLRGYYSEYTHDGHFILIGRQGALCGNINYAKGKFWASEHAVIVTPKKSNAIIWLGELLRLMNLNQYSISAAQPGLAVDKIKELILPLPSYSEQQAIADFISHETEKIDTLIAKVEAAIEKLTEYRTALISAAVTGKIMIKDIDESVEEAL